MPNNARIIFFVTFCLDRISSLLVDAFNWLVNLLFYFLAKKLVSGTQKMSLGSRWGERNKISKATQHRRRFSPDLSQFVPFQRNRVQRTLTGLLSELSCQRRLEHFNMLKSAQIIQEKTFPRNLLPSRLKDKIYRLKSIIFV